MSEVFIHVDAAGARPGNGGFKMLACLAQALAVLKHKVSTFNPADSLQWGHFGWLSWSGYGFGISSFNEALASDGRIVTSWLMGLLRGGKLAGGLAPERLRYWCQGEILRDNCPEAREFTRLYCAKIAINNRALERYYRELGFDRIIYLDNWLCPALFKPDAPRRKAGTIGHQSDNRHYEAYKYLVSRFGKRVLLCEGDQAQVARRMQESDYYVFFNRFPDCFSLFQGESFGLSLFEALACGCACVARRHGGNEFLEGTVPLVDSLDEAARVIEGLDADPARKEEIRARGLQLIAARYRFDGGRRDAIATLLE